MKRLKDNRDRRMKRKFDKILEEEKANPSTYESDLDQKAKFFEEKGFYNEAIELYCIHAKAHINNGWAYQKASRIAWSKEDYEKEKKLLIKYSDSYGHLDEYKLVGECELRTTGNLEKATEYYKKTFLSPESIIWNLEKNPLAKKDKKFNDIVNSLRKEAIKEYKEDLKNKEIEIEDIQRNISRLEKEL